MYFCVVQWTTGRRVKSAAAGRRKLCGSAGGSSWKSAWAQPGATAQRRKKAKKLAAGEEVEEASRACVALNTAARAGSPSRKASHSAYATGPCPCRTLVSSWKGPAACTANVALNSTSGSATSRGRALALKADTVGTTSCCTVRRGAAKRDWWRKCCVAEKATALTVTRRPWCEGRVWPVTCTGVSPPVLEAM